ncbi:hypothetical protein BH10BAC6_BH10BAC6_08530 [soil metagenome]
MYLDVFFLPADPLYGWVCSEDGRVIRTTDGGTTWLGAQVEGRPFLESIQFLTPLVGYTSGPGGIFRSNNGGVSWFDVSPSIPTGDNPWGSFFLTQNEGVYLVGGCKEPPRFYRTINGGASWSYFEANDIGTGLTDALLYRDGSGYAASSGVIWSTNDYGRTWNEFATSGFRTWNEELAHVGRSFLVPSAGSECFGGGLVTGEYRFSTDMGASWTRFRTPSTNYGTFLVSERAGWGVGSSRQVYYTSDAGQSWDLRVCGIDAESNLDDIWMISDTLGFVVGTEVYRSNFNARPRIVTIAQGDLLYVCEGDSVLLTSTPNLLRYKWTDGRIGPDRYASKAGRYIVSAFDTLTCTASADTITLRVYPTTTPLILNGLSGATYCFGDSAMLRVTNGPYRSFKWSTGDTTDAVVVRTSASVTVTAIDSNGCVLRSKPFVADIRPLFEPTIAATGKTTICLDDSVTLVAPRGKTSYLWSTGETSQSITVKSAGTYHCDIIDEYGCPGSSNNIVVVVLNLRNQIDVQEANLGPGLHLPDVVVGALTCRDLVIRNRDTNRPLVISRPFMVVNLRCSMPQGQFPIVIAPLETKTLRVCCSALDSGVVIDTIIVPDTCRDVPVPVYTIGRTETLTGTSRCNLPVSTTIIRAGSTYQIMAPYPNPATSIIEMEVLRIGNGDAPLLVVEDAVRRELLRVSSMEARVEGTATRYVFRVDVSMLPTGPYVFLLDANGPAGAVAVTVLH